MEDTNTNVNSFQTYNEQGMPVYRVFVKKGCSRCALVTRKLDEAGVDYTPLDISKPEYMQLARQMMVQTAGQIIDQNSQKVSLESVLKEHTALVAQQANMQMVQDGAVQNPDGTWTNPDGTIVQI